ncbi:hypothetical protein HD597_000443 [Nonomuraea thailandensis]|uniref:Uncharacterized protein n=1 Tax=Nonomuraea thailandensis TaxID=1188745 RepID=A0A9X2JY42_9ACTN|nr:hypothetical protein [Nonomuraea thailandensis]MCP2353423.1 hypothetical protein [Nonomuraea thailandensis]
MPALRHAQEALFGALSESMNRDGVYAETAWRLVKALSFLLDAADRDTADPTGLMGDLTEVGDSAAAVAARVRALLAAAVPVLDLACFYDDNRLNRAALGDSVATRVTVELLEGGGGDGGYAGPRNVLDAELAGASMAVKRVRHGVLPTGGLALLDWDAVLRAAAAAYDWATALLREEPEPGAAM